MISVIIPCYKAERMTKSHAVPSRLWAPVVKVALRKISMNSKMRAQEDCGWRWRRQAGGRPLIDRPSDEIRCQC
jgi:hypothetical protein